MAKANYTPGQLKACELMDDVRAVLAVHQVKEGWICRPHHTLRQLKFGHRLYGREPYITAECETMAEALRRLGWEERTGYQVTLCCS